MSYESETNGLLEQPAPARRRRRREKPSCRVSPGFVILCAILITLTAAVGVTAAVRLASSGASSPEEAETNVPDSVRQDFLTPNEWSRPGDPLETVTGVVLHYVGNPGTSAQANRNYFESLSSGELKTYASSHFIVGLEGEVIQCVPLTEIAYASNTRNADTVSVEVCHPDEGGEYAPASYRTVVELTAWLCREFRLEPETDVIRHYDVTGKLCPLYYVEHEAAWAQLLDDIAAEIQIQEEAEKNS